MSKYKTLTEHAAKELTRAGLPKDPDPEARKIASDTIALVRRFEQQNHNEQSGKWVLNFFNTLCNFYPLTAITNDPNEWEKFEVEKRNTESAEKETKIMWQNRRCPSIISEDEGKTWIDQATNEKGTSEDYDKWMAKQKADLEKRIKEAEEIKKQKPAEKKAKNLKYEAKPSATKKKKAPRKPRNKPQKAK